MVFSVLTSLLTANIIPLKQSYCISTITPSMPSDHRRLLSCLCLLDLTAAFSTIDHDILISRLSSWFGIHGSVLNWFKSYLTSRFLRVKCDKDFSSEHISCGVLQGSVLGPVLFVMYMYTTLLSTLYLPTLSKPPHNTLHLNQGSRACSSSAIFIFFCERINGFRPFLISLCDVSLNDLLTMFSGRSVDCPSVCPVLCLS